MTNPSLTPLPRPELPPPVEQLARRLDQVLPPHTTTIHPQARAANTPDPLINLAVHLSTLDAPELTSIQHNRIESRMFAAFDALYAPAAPVVPRAASMLTLPSAPAPVAVPRSPSGRRVPAAVLRRLLPLVAAFIGLLIVMGSTAGAAYASASSLPGDLLYPVKLLLERAELTLAPDPSARTLILIAHAERRTDEAERLLDRGTLTPAVINAINRTVIDAQIAAAALPAPPPGYTRRLEQVVTEATVVIEEAAAANLIALDAVTPPSIEPPVGAGQELPPPLAEATAVVTPTSTSTAPVTETPAPTVTAQPTRRPPTVLTPGPTRTVRPPRPSVTPTDDRGEDVLIPRPPTRTPVSIQTPQPPVVVPPGQPTACPGQSCNSQGVPGGHLPPGNPNPSGGGTGSSPPAEPGHPNQSGQGSPPSDPGGAAGNNQGGSEGSSGGGSPPADPGNSNPGGQGQNNPPPDPGGQGQGGGQGPGNPPPDPGGQGQGGGNGGGGNGRGGP